MQQTTVTDVASTERVTESPRPTQLRRQVQRSSLPIVLGVASAGLVLALRSTGILVGPVAIVLVILTVVFAPGPRNVSERFVIVFALAFGWLPLVGWLPGIGTALDIPGIVLAAAVAVTIAHQIRKRSATPTIARPTIAEMIGVTIGVAVALWWGLPVWRLGLSGRLSFLLLGFDNNSQFGMFQSNLQLGGFVFGRRHLPAGGLRVNWDYPQGMHQAWAQFARLWSPHPPMSGPWVLNAYITMLIISMGAVVILGCMAISRLCRRDLVAALPAMAAVVAIYGTGRFNFFNSFPNFDLATAAAAVAVTLSLRPTLNRKSNFFAIAGLGLVVAYNWYLMVIVVAPAVIVAALRARENTSGRRRFAVTTAITITGSLFVLPITLFFHHGANTLTTTAGTWEPPWSLLILSVIGLIGVVIYRQAKHADLVTNGALVAPAILGGGATLLLILYDILSTKIVGYYGQKFAAGIFAACVVVLVAIVANEVSTSGIRRLLPGVALPFLAGIATIGALQIDGYVGPDAHALGTTDLGKGFELQRILTRQPHTSTSAQALLTAAAFARMHTPAKSGDDAGQWSYIDPQPVYYFTYYYTYAMWFSNLKYNMSERDFQSIYSASAQLLNSIVPEETYAHVVINQFGNPEAGRFHIFVPPSLKREIIRLDPAWSRAGVLLTIPTPKT